MMHKLTWIVVIRVNKEKQVMPVEAGNLGEAIQETLHLVPGCKVIDVLGPYIPQRSDAPNMLPFTLWNGGKYIHGRAEITDDTARLALNGYGDRWVVELKNEDGMPVACVWNDPAGEPLCIPLKRIGKNPSG